MISTLEPVACFTEEVIIDPKLFAYPVYKDITVLWRAETWLIEKLGVFVNVVNTFDSQDITGVEYNALRETRGNGLYQFALPVGIRYVWADWDDILG